jgi:phage shock protein PspC (stress-responsive transcriptional regulator)
MRWKRANPTRQVYGGLGDYSGISLRLVSVWVLLTSLCRSWLTVQSLFYIIYTLSSLPAFNELKAPEHCPQSSQYPMSYKWHFILICRFPALKWIIYKAELVGTGLQQPAAWDLHLRSVSTLLLGECEVSHCPVRSEDLTGTVLGETSVPFPGMVTEKPMQ